MIFKAFYYFNSMTATLLFNVIKEGHQNVSGLEIRLIQT